MRSLLPLLFLAAGSAAAAQQDVYKWTDDEGVTHYSDPKFASQVAKPVTLPSLDTVVSRDMRRPPPADPALEAFPEESAELDPPMARDESGMPEISAEFEESAELGESDFATLEFQGASGAPSRSEPVRHEISLYRWTDEKGLPHYGNQPPGNAGARELNLEPPAGTVIRMGEDKP